MFLKKNPVKITCAVFICLFLTISLLFVSSGCSNKKLVEKQKQFKQMPDNELLKYYYELNDRLDDIDRDVEKDKNRAVNRDDSHDAPDMLHHLHIGDTWHQLQQEKKLILKELQMRNITIVR